MTERDDRLAWEEPLEIQVIPAGGSAVSISVTMRTPGHDEDLASGFLLSEGVIHRRGDVLSIDRPAGDDGTTMENTIRVHLTEGVAFDPERLSRYVFTNASCGICGRVTLDEISGRITRDPQSAGTVEAERLYDLAERLRDGQALFADTGGVHGAALFDAAGNLAALREDVGRHNALDKLIGALLRSGVLPADDSLLLLSGRIGFELVQKALCAGIPIIAAVGAPTSLAVELAARFGVTLVGFLKAHRFNVYTGAQRIT
ncbi:MAG: formate dehydrogenase accessory sulfurtransferase FdhD [Acidobacteriota bacterium]|nr:formate dehydrogenase accessory sulfurtransferase FdhD [Acidobacteriota bacterium]